MCKSTLFYDIMKLPIGKEKNMKEGYYLNKISHYAYAFGFVSSVLNTNITDEEKIKRISDEISQLQERLTMLRDKEDEK